MTSQLEKLDELARDEAAPPWVDSLAADLIEEYATTTARLRTLVIRYGASLSPRVVAALATVLNRRAFEATEESASVVFDLISRLRLRSQPQVLQNCLSAVSRILWSDTPWRPPESLAGFVLECLALRGGQAWVVHSQAIEFILRLSEVRGLDGFCDVQTRAQISAALRELLGSLDDSSLSIPAHEALVAVERIGHRRPS